MMPSDSGSRRAASGGALERRKMATASRSRTAATIQSVLRVRLCIEGRQRLRYHLGSAVECGPAGLLREDLAAMPSDSAISKLLIPGPKQGGGMDEAGSDQMRIDQADALA